MAAIQPNSKILLLSGVPLFPTYTDTIYFETAAAQESYFKSKVVSGGNLSNYSYQRVNSGACRVQGKADLFYGVNYMMFQNTAFGTKWFYAFVTQVEYVNNETTDIFYEIDVLQTYHFDYYLNACFVERQHTPTDNVGEHTMPEPIDIGPFKCIQQFDTDEVGTQIIGDPLIGIFVIDKPHETQVAEGGTENAAIG